MRLNSLSSIVVFHFLAYSALLLAMKAIPNGPFVLVVADPFGHKGQAMEAISGAGGSLVEATSRDWMAVAYSDDKNFARRLRQSGALVVFNYPVSAGCLQRSQ